jgi:DNA-binding beta-propeller fold protein YncE
MGLIFLPATASAESAWQYKMSLTVQKTGDSMYMPSSIAFDKQEERYYVVDTGRNRLVSFDRKGQVIKAFTANGQLKSPFDIARLDSGQLWVVEKGRNSLTFIDIPAKKIETNTLEDGDHLIFPDRISVSGDKIYILDRSKGEILRLNGDLSIEQRFGCTDCSAGMSDFVLVNDSVLALEPRDKKIYRFQSDGSVAEVIKLGEEIGFPVSLAVGPSGFIFVLDRHESNILVYDLGGHFRYRFLSPGQAAGQVYFARQLRFDPWGQLCVVDEGNGRVEIYSR